jgi:hypothetical protein
MIKMNVSLDDQALHQILSQLSPFGKNLPMTEVAVKSAAGFIRDSWRGYALRGSLGGIEQLKRPNGGYARSIKIERHGPLAFEIYSEAEIAEWLEKGTQAYDMKKTHTTGPRSRVSELHVIKRGPKKGQTRGGYPYLIVPFRWGTPGALSRNVMPVNVYNTVKKFNKMKTLVSADKSPIKTPNARGQMVGRAKYNRNYDQLSQMDSAGTVQEKTRMDGMVRAMDETGKDRAGGYFTFRVISSDPRVNPRSWWNPGIKARPVTETVAKVTKDQVSSSIENALRGDLGL